MGWLQRLFGINQSQDNGEQSPAGEAQQQATAVHHAEAIPPERRGLNGEYDQSGLAKRVALAYDEDEQLKRVDTLYVAQTGSTVVLKGRVANRDILNRMVAIAMNVSGTSKVDTNEVTIGA